MGSLDLADTFVTFLALIGPQKVLLSYGRLSRTLDDRSVRAIAVATSATAAIVGVICALTAPWVVTFFHIGAAELNLAAGLLFVIYAIGLVLGIHFDTERQHGPLAADDPDRVGDDEADPSHPMSSEPGLLERAQRLGLRVIPWTVNDPADMRRLADWGVDGLITDWPDRALRLGLGPNEAG